MNISKTSILIPLFTILIGLLMMMGCESQGPVSAGENELLSMEMPGQAASMLNSNAPFPVLNQGFNNDLMPWVDQSKDGLLGWCGKISLTNFKESGVKPSAGKGFALVSNDICNVFWNGVWSSFGPFPDGQAFTSGPASGPNPDLLRSTFPENGFVQELDIYLDPEYPSGVSTPIFGSEEFISSSGDDDVVFTYANSVCLNCELTFETFQPLYFAISVVKDDDSNLLVDGYEVKKKGWYTFRQMFGSDADGKLTVTFQLVKNGMPLYTEAIETTALLRIPTSSLYAASLGNGYVGFSSIADGLELPIDEHRVRPGK